MTKKVLLSLDVEEFDIPEEYGQNVDEASKIRVTSEGLVRVLDLFDAMDITATFYTTVYFAQNQPALTQRIIARHELASHGYYHSKFSTGDLLQSRRELERLSGRRVSGFRRSRFEAVDPLDVLAAGYTYNSSENPIWLPGRYMHLFKPRLPYYSGGLLNLPVSASPVIRYPFFWLSFKNSPLWLFRQMSRWTLEADGYLNIFFHPWEFADLSMWRLPALVKRLHGEKMFRKFQVYLGWLKKQAEFMTSAAFTEEFKQKVGGHGPQRPDRPDRG